MNAGLGGQLSPIEYSTLHGFVHAVFDGTGRTANGVFIRGIAEGFLVRMLGRAHRKRGCRYGCCREDGRQLSFKRYRKIMRAAERRQWQREMRNDG